MSLQLDTGFRLSPDEEAGIPSFLAEPPVALGATAKPPDEEAPATA